MSEKLAQEFVNAVRSVVGTESRIGLHEPEIGDIERQMVNECLESTFVSSVGPFVDRLEQEIKLYTGSGSAIAVSNGTVALQVALVVAGVQPGDEVIVPALSFIATANAVAHAGAVPYFVDSNVGTLGMDPAALRTVLDSMDVKAGQVINPVSNRRVAAIVPMHTLGHPADIVALLDIADEFGLPLVEDAAESLGSFAGGQHTGTFGDLGVLSFNGNKIMTTGGGGMILARDPELGARAKHLTTTAKVPHKWEFEHDALAWNFRMPNINAALGVAQLSKLPRFRVEKKTLAKRYAEAFAGIDGLTFVASPAGTDSNYWLNAVRINTGDIDVRNQLLDAATSTGLMCRPMWNLLSEQRMYAGAGKGDLRVATQLHATVICLPSSPKLAG